MKSELINRAIEVLRNAGYDVLDCSSARSCFDIIAKKNEILLIKVLTNIESLGRHTSIELRNIAGILSGIPLIIGENMKSSKLSNGVVYMRYEIRIVNLDTFADILGDRTPLVYSVRGNYCMNINSELLVQLRRGLGMTQEELAVELRVSKQSIYRYESSGNISIKIAERLMEILDEDIAIPNKLVLKLGGKIHKRLSTKTYKNLTGLERAVIRDLENIGFSTLPTNAPFDIFAREKSDESEKLFTIVSNDGKRLRHRIKLINEISELLEGYRICISDRREDNAEVLIIKPGELHKIRDSQELIEMSESF